MNGKTLQVILAPYDVERRDTGMAQGPRQLVERGFLHRLREAGWEVHTAEVGPSAEAASREETVVAVGRGIARAVALARADGRFPLVLSGGCLASVGVVAGLQQRPGSDVGVVWIDAHGDFNTPESSPSGYWDGMALAVVCGRSLPAVAGQVGLRPVPLRNVVHLAGRDFDPLEAEDVRRLELAAIPPDRIGEESARERLRRCVQDREIYLHVDLDGLDPEDGPAASVPVPGGPRFDDLLDCLAALPRPAAMTFSALGFERASEEEAERTVGTCARLLEACAAP